jgi:septal ring factor EnvC (AmiA/AmiB activator)
MRKTMLWCSLISVALLGGACKKSESEKAADQVRKSVEEVRDQREDVREEQKDVAKEQKDVTKEQRELAEAQGELAKARANYVVTARERLARIDAKINDLERRADAKSKDAAITLRARRDALASKLDSAASRVDDEWTEFRSDLDGTFKQIENDIEKSLD